ncbi:MAG TPA: hypothetical protein VI197_11285 [Polyangiaceae bacterium]
MVLLLLVGGRRLRHLAFVQDDPVFLRFAGLNIAPTARSLSRNLKKLTSRTPQDGNDAVEHQDAGLSFGRGQVTTSTRQSERHHGFTSRIDSVFEARGTLSCSGEQAFATIESGGRTGPLHLLSQVTVVTRNLARETMNQLHHLDQGIEDLHA